MAKKKSSKRKPVRRRRIGATGKLNPASPMVFGAAAIAGFAFADKINAQLDKVIPANIDGKIVGAAEIGIGTLLFMRGKKTMVKTVVGGVLAGAGAKKAMQSFGIGGFDSVPVVSGYNKVPVVSGTGSVAGYIPNAGLNGYTTRKQSVANTLMDHN